MPRTFAELKALRPGDPVAIANEVAALRERQRAYQLRELRANAGLTQSELAAMMEVGQNRVSQIENGGADHSRLDTLRKYAEALGGNLSVQITIGDHSYTVA